MKSLTKKSEVFFWRILLSVFILGFYNSVSAQSAFNRNDNYDFRGKHYLVAGGSSVDNFNLFITEDSSDFRKFNLHIKKDRLHLSGAWLAWQYRVDMNNDGTWEQGWTTSNEITVSYTYPNPTNGISANHTIKVEIQYQENPCCGTINRTKYIPVTIFSTTRVYVDSDNNSFIQLRDEDAANKIPVLMVEGFDPLNDKFPEIYYNLTWYLVNTDLIPNGYEVFILNFNNGGRDLRLNATVLLKAIEKIHEICPSYKIVLAGLSMGGPIGRYALAKVEQYSGTHNVGLFVSYDSPQAGAHVSPGLQDWIKQQNPNEGAVGELQANLQSVAAKQMLLYNTYDPNHIFFHEFYDELNALNGDGYPHQSYNVSASNGNFQATWGKSSVGRHLLTLKINDNLIHHENAVDWDCFTGSKITNITMKRYADIFNNPFIHVWYELQIIFNPAYQPTWSSLDFTPYHDDFGNLIEPYNSKFDSYVVQTTPLEHHELSQVTRNRITDWLNLIFNISLNYSLLEGGSANPDNHQVQILHGLPITVPSKNVTVNGKQVTYNFLEWSDGDKSNPRTFFTSHDVSKTAIMKGSLVSNNASGFSSNSQRKIVRTDDGKMHMVYESLGSVWYTISTDGGSTWQPEQRVNPYGTNAKGASIAQSGDGFSYVYIVYQIDRDVFPYMDQGVILAQYFIGVQQWVRTVYNLSSYTYDTKPVVAALNNVAYVVFKPTSSSTLMASGVSGDGTVFSSISLNNTTSSSTNPSLAAAIQDFYLAYQNGNTEIRYFKFYVNGSITDYAVVSTGSGFTNNISPSLSTQNCNPVVSWSGYSSGIPTVVIRRKSGTTWSTFKQCDNGAAAYPSNNNSKEWGSDGSIIAWTNMYNQSRYIKFVNGAYTSIKYLPSSYTGQDLQISNGDEFEQIKTVNFDRNISAPYPVRPIPYNFNTMQKISNGEEFNYARLAVIGKKNAEIAYGLGDIKLNGKSIRFVAESDMIIITNAERMTCAMTTESFSLSADSKLEFSDCAYIIKRDKTTISTDNIKPVIELVNSKTGVGVKIKEIAFVEKDTLDERTHYKLDCASLSAGEYYLRVKLNAKENYEFCLSDCIYEENKSLPKKYNNEIALADNSVPKEYKLEQNYPNPFNPATTINYQLPKSGSVTLKIFDILGNEVKTLVNEQKEMGRYTAQFDASSLASGMYLYQLRVNDYTSTKKMMLLK